MIVMVFERIGEERTSRQERTNEKTAFLSDPAERKAVTARKARFFFIFISERIH